MAAEPVGRWPEKNRSCKKGVFTAPVFRLPQLRQKMLRQQQSAAEGGKNNRRGRRNAHGVCRPGRNTAVRRKKNLSLFCARLLFVCADSRFAKPRIFLRKERFSCFSLVRKEPKVHQRFANLWTPGTIQSSAGSEFAKFSGDSCRNRFCPQTAGEKALNRCERVTVVQTQD